MIPRTMKVPVILASLVMLAACATQPVPQAGEVVVMKANEAPAAAFPVAGTVWRLDEKDLKTLSPAPVAEPPPPPRYPPPRAGEYRPPPAYYYPPAYGTHYYWRRW